MPTYNRQSEPGLFLETTSVLDVQSIYELDIKSDQFKEFLVNLRDVINNIALALNLKDTGYYDQREFVNGQVYFPNPNLSSLTPQNPTWRQVFRRVYLWPNALPNTNIDSQPHGLTITNGFTFTRIYGCASDTVAPSYIPIPYTGSTGNVVELWVDNVNINIRTNADFSAYTTSYVILEYIKN